MIIINFNRYISTVFLPIVVRNTIRFSKPKLSVMHIQKTETFYIFAILFLFFTGVADSVVGNFV